MTTYGKKVLVAGATGYLGRFVVREFRARDYYVRALTRSRGKVFSMLDDIDDMFVGEITDKVSLKGICDDVDIVFSSIGITRQKDGLTFRDVDYQGNMNLLEEAKRAGVKKFIYVSVLNGPNLRHLEIVKAHEDFVEALRESGMQYTVVRPTGYFSDMEEFLKMAKTGAVYLLGEGSNRMNPIHGADLATACADAVDCPDNEIEVGGPEVLTYREIGQRALQALKKKVRIKSVPVWMMKAVVSLTRVFSRQKSELFAFFLTASTTDTVATVSGSHTLEEHFEECAAGSRG